MTQGTKQQHPRAGQWSEGIEFTVRGPRGEGEAAAGDPPAAPPIDATNPEVQKLIAAAVGAFKLTAEEEKGRILANKEEILKEKQAAADERNRLKQELEDIRTKTKANEHGVDPEKYKADVDNGAQAKFQVFAEEHKLVLRDREEKLTAATAEIENLKVANRRAWTESQLMLAAIPESAQLVHPGAWDQLVTEMGAVIEPRSVEGVKGQVARVVVNGTLLPTTGGSFVSPDGMMTPVELMALTRQGKGPLGAFSYLFRSTGQGSDTVNPKSESSVGAGRKWGQLSDAEKAKVWSEDSNRAKEMVDADLQERAKAAAPGVRRAA